MVEIVDEYTSETGNDKDSSAQHDSALCGIVRSIITRV